MTQDVGSHYRFTYRHALSNEEIEAGVAMVKMDPYRICTLYEVGGGPLEHMIKKALRGVRKGHSEDALINELQACLDRWKEMVQEDRLAL